MKEIVLFASRHANLLVGILFYSLSVSAVGLLLSCLRSKRGRGQIR